MIQALGDVLCPFEYPINVFFSLKGDEDTQPERSYRDPLRDEGKNRDPRRQPEDRSQRTAELTNLKNGRRESGQEENKANSIKEKGRTRESVADKKWWQGKRWKKRKHCKEKSFFRKNVEQGKGRPKKRLMKEKVGKGKGQKGNVWSRKKAKKEIAHRGKGRPRKRPPKDMAHRGKGLPR
jgi:hypothetical protein